jgi:hypothetical protein
MIAIKTNSIKLAPSWEAAGCSATEKFPNIQWNPKVNYCSDKKILQSPFWKIWIQSIPSNPISLTGTMLLPSKLRPVFSSGLLSSWFPYQSPTHITLLLTLATYPAHRMILDLTILSSSERTVYSYEVLVKHFIIKEVLGTINFLLFFDTTRTAQKTKH